TRAGRPRWRRGVGAWLRPARWIPWGFSSKAVFKIRAFSAPRTHLKSESCCLFAALTKDRRRVSLGSRTVLALSLYTDSPFDLFPTNRPINKGGNMRHRFLILMVAAVALVAAGCAISDYDGWPNHQTQSESKLFGSEISF